MKNIDDLSSRQYFLRIILMLDIVAIIVHFVLKTITTPKLDMLNPPDRLLVFMILLSIGPILYEIAKKVRHGDFGADFLAIIAVVTGVFLQEYLAAVLILMMLTGGEILEAYAMRKASSALNALAERMPNTAHKKNGKDITEINISEIAIGDLIVIFPHETATVDGSVVEGHGSMNESYLTGEPYEVTKTIGSSVISGAINGESVLVIQAEKLAQDSRHAQIMTVMQEAEQKRPAMRRLGDQIGTIFAPIALIFAFATWYFTGDTTRFLAVLVVATPCPLLIAIPITLVSAISMAAKRGIIIKDPTVLERLPTCRTAIFDKTGTLTYGKPELVEILTAGNYTQEDILKLSATLERYSKHPLASAIIEKAKKDNLTLFEAKSVSEKPGQGLSGIVDGRNIQVTHRKKLLKQQPEIANLLPPSAAGLECIILIDDNYAATLRFRDAPRPDGKSFIGHLEPAHMFRKIMLVSGDREIEVSYLANLLGIKETLSSQSPEQKVSVVRAETLLAPTLFMGDGINDAPALASATVGIAFGQQSSVTSEAAGAVILESSLVKVDELLHISIAMRKIMLQSVIGGMTLSLVAMGFAAYGYITPVMGALIQEAIDVAAIANALRMAWGRKIATDFYIQKR